MMEIKDSNVLKVSLLSFLSPSAVGSDGVFDRFLLQEAVQSFFFFCFSQNHQTCSAHGHSTFKMNLN